MGQAESFEDVGRIGPDEGWGRNATVLLTLQGRMGFIPPVFWDAKV
jgi:hypothetical protein